MSLSRREFISRTAAAAGLVTIPGFFSACLKSGASLTPSRAAPGYGTNYFSQAFGIDETLLRKVMAEALIRGGDFCDLYFEHSVSHSVRLQDGTVNSARATVELGVGIRVVQGTHFGYAFTEELTLESMLKAADTASTIATPGSAPHPAPFAIRSTPDFYPIETVWESVGMDRKMDWLKAVDTRMRAADSRVVTAGVYFGDTSKRILIVTSEGLIVEDYQPMTQMGAQCVASQRGVREGSGFNLAAREGAEYYTTERLNLIADEAVRRTVQLFDAVRPPSGELPVVLGPGPSGILLHEAIGHGIEADFNRKRVSIFSERMDQRVAIPEVTIVDSGIFPNVRGSINVDDEGNLSRETVLVEQGILRSYIHDRISATHYRTEPTGSGRRESFRYAPMPRMRNTFMLNGTHSPEEVMAGVKRGIYAESFRNGQVNIGEGSFSFYIASGYMIENGQKKAPIKDVNIIGNGPEVLGRISKVGNDLSLDVGGWTCGKNGQSVPVSQGLPTTLVSSITIGGSEG